MQDRLIFKINGEPNTAESDTTGMRFVPACWSPLSLFLIILWLTPPAAVVTASEEVTPDKAGFLDGVGGSKESNTEDGATTRIVGGVLANKTRYPFYTALFENFTDEFFFVCGGALIRPNVVITAGEYCQHDDSE